MPAVASERRSARSAASASRATRTSDRATIHAAAAPTTRPTTRKAIPKSSVISEGYGAGVPDGWQSDRGGQILSEEGDRPRPSVGGCRGHEAFAGVVEERVRCVLVDAQVVLHVKVREELPYGLGGDAGVTLTVIAFDRDCNRVGFLILHVAVPNRGGIIRPWIRPRLAQRDAAAHAKTGKAHFRRSSIRLDAYAPANPVG